MIASSIQFFFRKDSFSAKRRIHKVRLCEIRIGTDKSLARLSGDEVPGSRAAAVNGTRKPQGVSRGVTHGGGHFFGNKPEIFG